MWAGAMELRSQQLHVDPRRALDRLFAGRVLARVTVAAKANAPFVGRLDARAAVCSDANVRALDRYR